ncbi:uncharacterized protein C1orf167 homolog isoform X1 [Gallus gallus]|uniref:uncharacterized protein C1orf167 homolog isoform X1 n=3 Tax=Gallus gallus TaxID=9031 RepID=UPI001AEB0EF0|nr:uncharacterized protein C1orf167 homolog isoform X1 [Gallus gallus]XP_040507336.1 uncharacterized protein C1orf167 homolog isoform X1 [Gallus gallus]XP_040545197.1 uncharacterized protein C1orf167 homolog isoform X1 [Gallus gallus]XP_040545198.1 uncharacterized protein C1orf167 homolog isoform X1 [Gallus gallus]
MDTGNPPLVNTLLPFNAVDCPLRHKSALCTSSRSSREGVNICCSSALTSSDLSPSNLESLQSLLQSSQISAALYCSIRRLKQEIAFMGSRASLPLEPKSSPVGGSLCFALDDPAPIILSTREQLAGVKTSAAQARLRWSIPFAKGTSLGAVMRDFGHAEPLSVSHRCRYVDSSMWRTKLSGGIHPDRLSAGVGSGRFVDTEDDSSNDCSPYFRCQSQVKPALETGGFYVHTKNHSYEKVLKAEGMSGEASPCAMPWKKKHPESLHISLETWLAGTQMNVGVSMHGTPREVCVRVTSSGDQEFRPVQQLSIKPVEVENSRLPVESSKGLEKVCDCRSRAASSMAVGDSSQSSPFSTQVGKDTGDCSNIEHVNANREERRNKHFQQSSWRNWEAPDHSEEPSVERNAKEPQCCEEGSHTQETVPSEVSENSSWSSKVNEQSFQHLRDRQVVIKCFHAWRDHITCKRAAARQQQPQKALGASEVAQQRHASAILAASFHKWKKAVAKQSQKQAAQSESYSYTQSSSVDFSGIGRLATMTTSAQHQLTEGYMKEAEQACRVESELWTQLHRRQRGDEFRWRAQAIRDVRRLAAAFRLWRLQKELLSNEEARLLEACALLEKKRLQNIFHVWQSRYSEKEKILGLTVQIQRNLVSRCFSAWKEAVELKAYYKSSLMHLRVESMRKYFQQWFRMLQVRESNKQAMVNLLFLRWRQHYGPAVSSVSHTTATEGDDSQSRWTVVTQVPEKTGYSLDDFCLKMKLQRVYLLWKERLYEHCRADSFSQALEECRLRKALKLWHQKYLMLMMSKQSPQHSHRAVYEEPLAVLFCEERSTSSGFHSSAPTTLASQSSLEKEYSFSDSSQQSCSSVLTAEDVTYLPYYSSFLQLHQSAELPAELGGELCLQASFPPWRTGSGENWFVGGQFQSLALQNADNNVQPLVGYSTWEEDCSSEKEVETSWHQVEKCCLQKYFIFWSTRTQQLTKAQQYCRLLQLSRAFLRWHRWAAENKNQEVVAALKYQFNCCRMAFSLWKKRLAQKVEADQRFRCHLHQMTAGALLHWHSYCQRKCNMKELQQRWAQHSCQKKKRLILQTWRCQTRQLKNAALFWERLLLHRCIVTWAQVTACRLRQQEALCYFRRVREHHLLEVSFAEWRVKFLTAKQQLLREEKNHKWHECTQAKACQRWRLASRGQQALHLGSVATVKQACNYWTKAAAFSQCSRQCSTLIGARKSKKMSLSLSIKRRGSREKGSAPAASLGFFPSAVHRWLVIYRSQRRTERLLLPQQLERHDLVGPIPVHARIQENKAEVDSDERNENWLGRKYLRWWHHTVTLRRCQRAKRLRSLARGWQQWKEASRVVMLAQVLDQQQLIEKAWRAWRRRYLQSCVVQRFLEVEARSLLSEAFRRWRQLTAFQLKDRGHC